MASTRASSSVSRSRKAPVRPAARASARSSALAARIAAFCARTAAAMRSSARSFWAVEAERQRAGGRAAVAADLAPCSGGDIARSFDAFQRRGHAAKPVKPRYRVVFLPRRGSGGEVGRRFDGLAAVVTGDSVDNSQSAGTRQLTYTLGWQGGASHRR